MTIMAVMMPTITINAGTARALMGPVNADTLCSGAVTFSFPRPTLDPVADPS
jgi:hypothetical protein